jgi:pyruvate dehydrogenase E2 component (dihydrolipoamide acetyltransferase)
MAETVSMPKLGFDMAEGVLVRWVKSEGEIIAKGDILAEIETDKATVEVESPFSGVVARHLVEEKAVVPVGMAIAIVAAPGEKVDAPAGQPSQPQKPAPVAEAAPSTTAAPSLPPQAEPSLGSVKASPLARKIAMETGINLNSIRGSGPGGRIVRRDIETALAAVPAGAPVSPAAPAVAAPAPPAAAQPAARPSVGLPQPGFQPGDAQPDQHIPVDRLRAAIGRRMVESKQQLPHFYVTHEYNMAGLMEVRKQANELLPDEQKLSVNDFILKAVALALRQFPNLNASLRGNEIVRHGRVNIGVAVAVEAGLLTVVCKDADRKPLRLISQEVKEMVARARVGKVRPEDIEGSTFSISNLGMYDVEHFIAIINPPEAAILAVGSVKQQPVVVDGQLVVGTRMKATISADHRVSDGAEAAQFMQRLAFFLEKPVGLML